MKILVTGANGYLGQGIVEELLRNGNDVIATDLSTEKVSEYATRINANLFEIEDPYLYFQEPDILLHLAWRDGFIHYSNNHILDLPNHFLFLQKMFQSKVKQVCVMGSMHEVGFYEGSINEYTPCHPMSLYGISKDTLRNCVHMLGEQNGKLWKWLRGYYIVGNSGYGSSIFSKIVAAEIDGKSEFPFTLGENQFDFIDYQEFCLCVATAVCQDEINGIINICSGKPEKLATRVERFIKENNYSIKLKYGSFPDRPYDSKAIWGDSHKIEKIMKCNKNT